MSLNENQKVTALVLAGKRSGALDPLAEAAGVAQKCVVPVAGKPLIEHVGVARVARHALPEHGEETRLLRQTRPHRLPACAPVARPPDRRGGVGREPPRHVAVQRDRPDHVRIARMDSDREPEGRWQARADVVPASPAVFAPPDAVVRLDSETLVPAS